MNSVLTSFDLQGHYRYTFYLNRSVENYTVQNETSLHSLIKAVMSKEYCNYHTCITQSEITHHIDKLNLFYLFLAVVIVLLVVLKRNMNMHTLYYILPLTHIFKSTYLHGHGFYFSSVYWYTV